MRESRTYGSVRGALSNGRPYRVTACFAAFAHGRLWPKATSFPMSAFTPLLEPNRTSRMYERTPSLQT